MRNKNWETRSKKQHTNANQQKIMWPKLLAVVLLLMLVALAAATVLPMMYNAYYRNYHNNVDHHESDFQNDEDNYEKDIQHNFDVQQTQATLMQQNLERGNSSSSSAAATSTDKVAMMTTNTTLKRAKQRRRSSHDYAIQNQNTNLQSELSSLNQSVEKLSSLIEKQLLQSQHTRLAPISTATPLPTQQPHALASNTLAPQAHFVAAPRTYWISVSNADYDSTTSLLTVPVNMTQCTSFELVDVAMPRTMYDVNQFCDTLTIVLVRSDGTIRTTADVTLTRQDYETTTALATELQTRAAAALVGKRSDGGNLTLTVSASLTTYKFTFAMSNSQKFFFQFPQPTLGYMLGFGVKTDYPRTTLVTDDSAASYLVLDTEAEASATGPNTTTFGPSSAVSWSTVNLTIGGAQVAHRVFSFVNSTASFSSTTRSDLFGGRYVVIDCPQLKYHYANTSTVALIYLANDMNYLERPADTRRTFPLPATLTTLFLGIKVRLPTGKDVVCDMQNLAFVLRFAVTVNHMVSDRGTSVNTRHKVWT